MIHYHTKYTSSGIWNCVDSPSANTKYSLHDSENEMEKPNVCILMQLHAQATSFVGCLILT